ncbi:MAG TPA: cell envelope integrity protein CreD [Bacteroidales bacterium]|nr:cell envelope integrity protein CreD [Bacteroidales bacterium]
METLEKSVSGFFSSVGFKLGLIGFLSLLLLIPAAMILDLIRERQQRRTETINEVSSSWGNSQTITGPVLTIPYQSLHKNGKESYTVTEYAHFLPDNLTVEGTVLPEERHRGIYTVTLYNARLHVKGHFSALDLKNLNLNLAGRNKAYIEIGIPDMRGINKNISIQWGDTTVPVIPGLKTNDFAESGIHAIVMADPSSGAEFSFDLDLNGSQSVNFVPIGKETSVHLTSPWSSPSFSGSFLPDSNKVNEKGFEATWNILEINRNYPQQWINNNYSIKESAFGVDLLTPVDTYQKSERSAKYAILFIGLTFLVFFFAEIMTGIRVHPVSYILSGFALTIFYSLLIALAEYLPFNLSYFVAALVILMMMGLYTHSIYRIRKVTLTVCLALISLYTFLFVILQLSDYSLLFGNIGLIIILGIIMYFSRKIDWYSTTKKRV